MEYQSLPASSNLNSENGTGRPESVDVAAGGPWRGNLPIPPFLLPAPTFLGLCNTLAVLASGRPGAERVVLVQGTQSLRADADTVVWYSPGIPL
jgi:hypothetical protein